MKAFHYNVKANGESFGEVIRHRTAREAEFAAYRECLCSLVFHKMYAKGQKPTAEILRGSEVYSRLNERGEFVKVSRKKGAR